MRESSDCLKSIKLNSLLSSKTSKSFFHLKDERINKLFFLRLNFLIKKKLIGSVKRLMKEII